MGGMKKRATNQPRAYTAEETRDIVLRTIAEYVDYWENEWVAVVAPVLWY
jgi:hypothetical protein